MEIVRNMEEQLFLYLFTVTGINLALGTAVGIAMYLLGMPNPILWGSWPGLLTFIPYIGHIFGHRGGDVGGGVDVRRSRTNVSHRRGVY